MPEVCVDASLVIKWVISEEGHHVAKQLFTEWSDADVKMIAPSFFQVEVDSILRKKVFVRKEISVEEAEKAFELLMQLPIEIVDLPSQRQHAWQLAKDLSQATVYDTTYIALAELHRCEFWTADERLYNSVKHRIDFVRWIGEIISS
ncbi:type II toxin-antitoxin system VapC family toxin [Candidatus Poribacteria bacterium]|nr:type II toxin-antitoxin system VapC family toxin [Candidatus Poribacteria bacterium]